MPEKAEANNKIKNKYWITIEQICEVARQEYNHLPDNLVPILSDFVDLYAGRWPSHEACQVGYHNLDHALNVTLATARMIAGWNKKENKAASEDVFMIAMAAALFHDAGYIKDKGDTVGKGGKYTFNHVMRSMDMAKDYLIKKSWPQHHSKVVPKIISQTSFFDELNLENLFSSNMHEIIARMVASADLMAQMADVDYLQRINDLYDEFEEGYRYEETDALATKGIQIFGSADDIMEGTLHFYEHFVIPRLQELGRMDRYLAAFFSDGRNPYQENIAANLSGQLMDNRTQWLRLGEILEKIGVVTSEQINKAIERQRKFGTSETLNDSSSTTSSRLMKWLGRKKNIHRLGEILLDMEAVNPEGLCQGLLHQMLPPDMLKTLSQREMFFLLQVSILLHNYQHGPRVFDRILEMTNELLDCEASSILLADPDASEIRTAFPAGPQGAVFSKRRLPLDKGLAGWVYRHGKPATVQNVDLDKRFDSEVDGATSFHTTSILAMPFHINGEWIGVFEMLNKRESKFTEHDMDILTILVNIIGSVLGNIINQDS